MRFRTLLAVAALSAAPALLVAGDVIDTYDLDRTAVENSILSAYRGGWYAFDVTPALRALPPEQRAGAVRALGDFTKAYVASPAFKSEYMKAWKANKPRGFGLPSLDAKALAKKALEKAQGGGAANADHGLDKDPDVTLRRQLQEFLDLTEGVDYDAKTTGGNRKGAFADATYEGKPPVWKMCYRAGREAGEAARGYAKEWLAELDAAAAAKKK